ncbi:MAG: superoxide dismutase family protein, partial [Acidobacteria bacterium]|nr:superoxide dismutase family protein [Acidobacteriota bacterium]
MSNYRNWMVLFSFLSFVFFLGCAPAPQPAEQAQPPAEPMAIMAHAALQPTQGNTVQGTVHFEESGGETHVEISLAGLPPGKHGFHIHETGDCSAPDASSAGGHFNPAGKPHGAPGAAEHHIGDLGNVEADAEGKVTADLHFDFLSLEGPNSIIGKAVVVHAGED